jgi:hypothetical protein
MVERRSHVPTRSYPSVDGIDRLETDVVDWPSHINVRRITRERSESG